MVKSGLPQCLEIVDPDMCTRLEQQRKEYADFSQVGLEWDFYIDESGSCINDGRNIQRVPHGISMLTAWLYQMS